MRTKRASRALDPDAAAGQRLCKRFTRSFAPAGRLAPAWALAIFVSAGALACAQSNPPFVLEKTIPLPGVKGRIDHMAFDAADSRLFVSALGNNTVEVVDLANGRVLKTIGGLDEPQGVLYDAKAGRLWVANGGDGTVRIFNARTYLLLRSIALGKDADNVRLDPARDQVLVGYGSGGIATFDAKGDRIADVKLDVHPESFQLEANGPLMFVNLPNARRLDVIDRAKSKVVTSWRPDGARGNFPMALDERNERLMIVCRVPAVLLVLDMHSGAVVAKLPSVADADDVYYDPARRRIYVSGGGGEVDVYRQIDRNRYRRIAQVPTSAGARTSLFVPQVSDLFVAGRQVDGRPAEIRVFKISN